MKILGYKRNEINKEGLLEMEEISFYGSPKELKYIAKFLQETAEYIEKKPGEFDHDHISYNNPEWDGDFPDIIVGEEK